VDCREIGGRPKERSAVGRGFVLNNDLYTCILPCDAVNVNQAIDLSLTGRRQPEKL